MAMHETADLSPKGVRAGNLTAMDVAGIAASWIGAMGLLGLISYLVGGVPIVIGIMSFVAPTYCTKVIVTRDNSLF